MFVNTQIFREEALHFMKNGYYCPYPKGTAGYKEYWDEQTKRCIEGYTSGGVTITGVHYAYLNFAQIERSKEGSIKTKSGRLRAEKVYSFPDFWDGDFEYFWEVEKARENGEHLIVAKSRRKGFSFKNAFMCAHHYNFTRKSRSIISGFLSDYAQNTMNMTHDYLNFLNEHTAWRKNRLPDTKDFVRAAFEEVEDGVKVVKGYKSEIQAISFKDNPFKSIGKGVGLFLIDEAGKFPNLKATWQFTKPTLESGDATSGLGIIFGTGGDMEEGSVDFAEMFYSPEIYGFRSYDNRWDEDSLDSKCGYFFPDWQNREGHIDKDGNSLIESAIQSQTIVREQIKSNAKTRSTLTQHISQWPFTPREAFLRATVNMFPVAEISDWLSKLEFSMNNRGIRGDYGTLELTGPFSVKFVRDDSLKPIHNFPVKPEDDIEGAIVIWEHPTLEDGTVPNNLYIAGCDPIDQDEAVSSDSLGSVFIYKKFYKAGESYHKIVAEYTGRPALFNGGTDKFYETVRRLLMYYNARCLYENMLKGIKVYFQKMNSLHYLTETPTILLDRKIIKNSIVNRGYGIHMTPAIKRQGELYIADWLVQPVTDVDGEEVLRLHTIRSIPLLKELVSYDPNPKKNFDRVMALMCVLLQNEQDHDVKPTSMEDSIYNDPFWGKDLFKKTLKNASYPKITHI